MHFTARLITTILSLPLLAAAAPVPSCGGSKSTSFFEVTAAQLLAIMPTSNTCAGASPPDECRTAKQAAPAINKSFSTFQINTAGEAAALVSLMALESGEFKFARNKFPGRPGQGTRNMQMPDFNLKYARDIPKLSTKLNKIVPAGATKTTDKQKNAVLDLLLADDSTDFGSAAWFLTTKCAAEVRQGLQAGTMAGWEAYITSCVGTTVTPDRQAYYTKALTALGVAGN